jgi:hypothetical protein
VTLNFALWLAGLAFVIVGLWRIRAPLAKVAELDRLAENAKRYDSWRGNRVADDGTTGADVMREVLRRQAITWTVVIVVGVVLLVAGFVVR